MTIKMVSHKDERLSEAFGCYLEETAEIRIRDDLIAVETINTALHEIIHAIFHTYGISKVIPDREKEEQVVNNFANGLTQVLIDNPDLLDWIKS